MNRILTDVLANLRTWYRSPSAVFFTLMFPVLFIAIFGAILGGNGSAVPLVVQDQDHTTASQALIHALNETGSVSVHMVAPSQDAIRYAQTNDEPAVLRIPAGFGANLSAGQATTLPLWTDPSSQSAAGAAVAVRLVVASVNQQSSGTPPAVMVNGRDLPLSTTAVSGGYVAYLLPGVIGMTIMMNSLIGSLENVTTMRENGILRRLMATPLRRIEWVTARALYQVLLGFVSAATILLTGWALFGVTVDLGWQGIAILVLGATGFAGIAMILARWVTRPDQANAAGSAITFPMLFLSGAFFPIATMPKYLQTIAYALPLTWINEGLRAAIITGRVDAFQYYLGVLVVFAVAAVVLGAWATKWKEV